MQALSPGQSELITHSGWQPVTLEGTPWRPGKHLQTAESPIFWQIVLGPHGDGEQGSLSFGTVSKIILCIHNDSDEERKACVVSFDKASTLFYYLSRLNKVQAALFV